MGKVSYTRKMHAE